MSLFKFATNPTVVWPVTINEPLDDGRVRKINVKAKFEIITTPQQDEIYSAGGNDADLIRRVLKDWQGMPGADGQPVEFSPTALDELLAIPYARSSFVEAYIGASVGRAAARKN